MDIKKVKDKCGRGWRESGKFIFFWWDCNIVQPLWMIVEQRLKNFVIKPSNSTCISPPKIKREHLCTLECSRAFAALHGRPANQKQCKWPSLVMDKQNVAHAYDGTPLSKTWQNLKNTLLRERIQMQKNYSLFLSAWNTHKGQICRQISSHLGWFMGWIGDWL